jgi:hypothetical protein
MSILEWISEAEDWLNQDGNAGKASLVAAGLAKLTGLDDFFEPQIPTVGYQGKIPEYTAVQERVTDTYDPNRRPGSGGQRFFSETEFVEEGQEPAARQRAVQQAMRLKAENAANKANQMRQYGTPPQPQPQMPMPVMGAAPSQVGAMMPPPAQGGLANFSPQYRYGGLAALAAGGTMPKTKVEQYNQYYNRYSAGGSPASSYNRRYNNQNANGYYLGGPTDGMADKVPARIDNQQEARLSDGEFVIPADVVSHLGNGNSNAGAKNLYSMMDRVRKARTGNPKQGKQINPNQFMPKG